MGADMKRNLGLIVSMALMLGAAGVGFAVVQFPQATISVSVVESISISPGSQSITLHPNECAFANWTVSNSGNATIEIYFAINGNGTGSLTITPATGEFQAPPGDSVLSVTICASNGAIPGQYTLTVEFARE